MPHNAPKYVFCSEVIRNCIDLSYPKLISDIVGDEMIPIFPSDPQPVFKYENLLELQQKSSSSKLEDRDGDTTMNSDAEEGSLSDDEQSKMDDVQEGQSDGEIKKSRTVWEYEDGRPPGENPISVFRDDVGNVLTRLSSNGGKKVETDRSSIWSAVWSAVADFSYSGGEGWGKTRFMTFYVEW